MIALHMVASESWRVCSTFSLLKQLSKLHRNEIEIKNYMHPKSHCPVTIANHILTVRVQFKVYVLLMVTVLTPASEKVLIQTSHEKILFREPRLRFQILSLLIFFVEIIAHKDLVGCLRFRRSLLLPLTLQN